MAAKFYGKAEGAAKRIVEAFQNPGTLPAALAPIFIRRRDNVPCRQWSWSNQLLVAIHGHSDARGYRQWQEAGRHVKKGQRGFPILVPLKRKIERENPETGETDEFYAVYGFKHAIVFGLSQTDGEPVSTGDPDTDRWLESLPLLDVAEEWGLSVEAYNGQPGQAYGKYYHGQGITLGVRNLTVWAHEMIHAADDRRIGGRHGRSGNLKGGQHVDQEIVAQFGAAVLLTVLGFEHDADLGFTWQYVRGYAGDDETKALRLCEGLLKRTCDAVALILDTAEELKRRTEAVA